MNHRIGCLCDRCIIVVDTFTVTAPAEPEQPAPTVPVRGPCAQCGHDDEDHINDDASDDGPCRVGLSWDVASGVVTQCQCQEFKKSPAASPANVSDALALVDEVLK